MVVHMIYLGSPPEILTYPCPWGVELVPEHTSREPKVSSEVPSVLLGRAWYLDFLLSSWFPHRFKFEDHAIPWFCPKLRFSLKVVGFPIGLSLRTMQYLGSVQNL